MAIGWIWPKCSLEYMVEDFLLIFITSVWITKVMVCYKSCLLKRHHPPNKVFKNTIHIQHVRRQHWFVKKVYFKNLYPIHLDIFLLSLILHEHKVSKTIKTFKWKLHPIRSLQIVLIWPWTPCLQTTLCRCAILPSMVVMDVFIFLFRLRLPLRTPPLPYPLHRECIV